MAGIVRPNWALPPSQRGQFSPTGGAPAPAPAPTPTQTPGYNPNGTNTPVSGSAPAGGQYPQQPGTAPNLPGGQTPTGVTWGVDPTGNATPYTPYSSGPGQTSWRAGDPTNLPEQQMNNLLTLLGKLGNFGLMGGPQNPLGRETPGPQPGREVPTTMADRTAAETAAFARAKERIGKIGGGALMALRDRSTSGGRAGSGLESRAERDVVNNTASQLGEVVRDQTIDRMDRADEVDDRNVSVGVTQRGQDIGMRQGDYAGNIQQRGQDYNALLNPYQNPILSMVPSLFGMFRTY